jgi:Ankyrin repeat.
MDPDYDDSFVQFLIKKCNVNVNAQNFAGATPLHCAAGRNDASIFSTLLFLGADPELSDIRGNNPKMYGNMEIQKLVNIS